MGIFIKKMQADHGLVGLVRVVPEGGGCQSFCICQSDSHNREYDLPIGELNLIEI